MADEKLPQNFFQRHADKIVFAGPDDCWLWTAAKVSGYGSVGARGKVRKAHREAFEAEHGPGSADGLLVRHRCDVRACVNPAHLELGTHADNNRDMMERGRNRQPKGSAAGRAKLTEADVADIRAEYAYRCSGRGLEALARKFGVGTTVIADIVHRRLWRHV